MSQSFPSFQDPLTQAQNERDIASAVKARHNVPDVLALRRKMEQELGRAYIGSTPTGDGFKIFVDDVAEFLPKTIVRQNLYDSLSHLAGQKIDAATLKSNLWRIAGNVGRLRTDPVPPWNRQPFPEWVPVAIVAARKQRSQRGRVGFLFSFQVLAGLPCPLVINRFWSSRFCYFFSGDMGYSKRRPGKKSIELPRRVFLHPREYVTLRLEALIQPRLCVTEPGFEKVRLTPQLLEWNKEQLDYRDRLDAEHACPFNFPTSHECYQCHIGFRECRAACHRDTYLTRYCGGCENMEALFNPESSSELCVSCTENLDMKRES